MNPSYCIRNTGNLQNLFRTTQILFEATHIGFRTPRSVVRRTCLMLYLILI